MSKWHKHVNWNVVIVFEILAIVMALLIGNEKPGIAAAAADVPQEAVEVVYEAEIAAPVVEAVAVTPVVQLVSFEHRLINTVPAGWFSHRELPMVLEACKKNGCWTAERLSLVMAIRKAEGGGKGFEYGCVNRYGGSYRQQVGSCCATVRNFMDKNGYDNINSAVVMKLARKYAPYDVQTWYPNVMHWYKKFLPLVNKAVSDGTI